MCRESNRQNSNWKSRMAKNLLLGRPYMNQLFRFLIAFNVGVHCFLYGQVQATGIDEDGGDGLKNTFTISSFSYPETRLSPYDWSYIRVNLPPWFSSMTINLESDVDLDLKRIGKVPGSTLPMICFREGSPPLPDVHNTSITDLVLEKVSNGTFGGVSGLQAVEECYPMQKIISARLTNEQISPGMWYLGFFNGIGPMRTQSKMINRGQSYSFHGNITVDGCIAPTVSGQFCNKTVNLVSCVDGPNFIQHGFDDHTSNGTAEYAVICRNADDGTCISDTAPKIFSLDLMGFSEELLIKISNVTVKPSKISNSTIAPSNIIFTCYARHGAIPLDTSHDYYGNISGAPLVISRPKVGRWYITVQPGNIQIGEVCYSLEWQVLQCPVDKSGPNCTWKRYILQTVKTNGGTFESYYLPITKTVSFDSPNFPIEALLSNLSYGGHNDVAWTYFLVDVPFGAAGGNMHIHIASDDKINYEIYARYAGLPSLENWDYYCTNSTCSSNDSMFFMLYDASEKSMSFYILYAREGTWSFGLKHLISAGSKSKSQTTMSISMESCPEKCSSHGTCKYAFDTSGLTFYSYCACDVDHGGFDCSIELVSRTGHIWQSISLIASSAAAVLPAYWALRQKAFAEWVVFTASGISSGVYHACDVGTWCPLTFHVLQFMDFWLAFMAVVSTFVYLASVDETSKRTIHTIVAIVTALMTETGPTRSSNIVLVIAIGIVGLAVAWLIELSTRYRSISWYWTSWSWSELHLNLADIWQTMRAWMQNLIRALLRRCHWGFVIGGLSALALAALTLALETSKTYWIWHSIWHISIYTSSFLFLCSKAKVVNCADERLPGGNYALTRQCSLPRDD